jgi:galactonate dehydratase
LYDDVMRHPMVLRDGHWQVPAVPGLGVDLDEREAAKHPFAQEIIPAREAVASDGAIVDW